ncbi:MAG: hypothetical protein K2Y40_01330 [Reyranella sp.]|nr:hypothetical protein [Reyranella sp.]
MDATLAPLVRDLLEWVSRQPRTHAEVMDGWKTSCPRLPVWEEATGHGFVARRGPLVELTPRGRAFLAGPPRA